MNSTVIKGSPREVAEKISRLGYDVVEAIVFDAAANVQQAKRNGTTGGIGGEGIGPDEDVFAEMAGLTASAPDADDSREAIYTRMPDE